MAQVLTKDDAQTAADPAADAQAAKAAAEAGFASVDEPEEKPAKAEKPEKKAKPEPAQKTDAEKAAEAKVAEEAAARAAAEAEWEGVPVKVRQTLEAISGKVGTLDKLQHDFKSLAGRTGAALEGVNALKTALEAAKTVKKDGGEAPTQAQITAAAASNEAWERLKEDFPEWAEGTDKRIDQRVEERLAKLVIPPAVDAAALKTEVTGSVAELVAKATREARELTKLDLRYENWEEDVKAPEFGAWLAAQAPEIKALSESEKATDAIRLLDAYKDHRKAVAEATAKKERDKKRLDSAITPRGVAQPATRNLTEEEAKLQGFLSVDT